MEARIALQNLHSASYFQNITFGERRKDIQMFSVVFFIMSPEILTYKLPSSIALMKVPCFLLSSTDRNSIFLEPK